MASCTSRVRAPSLAAVLLLAAGAAAAQQAPSTVFRASALEVSIGGRVQTQLNTTTVDSVPTAELALRRVRLEANVRVNEVVSAKIQPEFAGSRVSLRDAYVLFGFHPALQLLAGQANRPFGIIQPTSSTRIIPVERGVRIRGVRNALDEHNLVTDLGYADRDVGLQLLGAPAGAPLGLSYALGVFNGPARAAVPELDSYQLAARAAVRPAERLRTGLSWSRRDFLVVAPTDGRELAAGQAWAVDVEYGTYGPGLHLVGEAAFGDVNPRADIDFTGAQAWLAYRTRAFGPSLTHLEPLFRVSYGDVDAPPGLTVPRGGTLLTPGINLYFGPLNRIMLNYDVWMPEQGDAVGSFKAQFQVAF
ncbi:MAG TPA: porin [Longimicrobiaceae bacterium]|nr:porin [Longimicrobiaceae bacterium]